MPWPLRGSELRRIEWREYLADPTVGLLVDPHTGDPYPDVIRVAVRVLDRPPGDPMEVAVGDETELPLSDFLTLESRRADLGRIPWAEPIGFTVAHRPPPVEIEEPRSKLPPDFEEVRSFLFETLAGGPVSELEVIGQAADRGIPLTTLREVKSRLRIASVRDEDSEYPRTLWRLRMSQAYKLKRRGSSRGR